MKPPRGLTPEEEAAWARLASTVTPLARSRTRPSATALVRPPAPVPLTQAPKIPKGRIPPAKPLPPTAPAPKPITQSGLDSHWERRLSRATTEPDFTLDLHGHTLEQAHARLDRGLMQAKAMGARLVLVVTGKPRPVDAADRGERRGAIRAKLLDWLAAGPHGADIAAVRQAQRRHGGEGALYLVLKRRN